MGEKEFEVSEEEMGGIQTFGEPPGKALVPEVVNDKGPGTSPFTASEMSGQKSVAMTVIDRGQALQQVRTQYVTAVAVQKPRDIGKVQEAVLKEADLAGASFMYGWNVKDRKSGKTVRIEGPSIDMAMSLARNYGNCVIDTLFTETETHFVFDAFLIDLESGSTIKRQFRQRRSQSLGGKMDKERAEDIVFQIGQSKATRNVVTKAMPGWLIEKAMETAKDGELKRIDPKQLPKYRQLAIKFFSSHDIEVKRIETALGKAMDKWMAEDIVELKGMMTALKEGRATTEELFPLEGTQDNKKEQSKTETPKTGNPPESEEKQGSTTVTREPNDPPGTTVEKTKKTKKTEKEAEPPEAPPQKAPPVAEPPPTAAPVANGQLKLGIIKCPDGGMRKGKLVHTRWCNENCKQKGSCDTFKAGPKAAV
jgi:hypothetical protein